MWIPAMCSPGHSGRSPPWPARRISFAPFLRHSRTRDQAMTAELPISFLCENDRMYGILHVPEKPAKRGILMVQGRPAYRVGPHRLYVELARAWAARGYPVMRMDYRGSG